MVARTHQLVQPALRCDCCHRQFVQGDKAVCIVKVPDGGYDTICAEDYAIVLASSASALKAMPTLDQNGLKRLLLDALDLFAESPGDWADDVAQSVKQALSKGQTS